MLPLCERGRLVFPALQIGHFLFQFLVAPVPILVQFACLECFQHGAAWLRGVGVRRRR